MNNFTELTISTTHIGGDIVSNILWNYTDSGVVISDIEDVIALAKDGKAWSSALTGKICAAEILSSCIKIVSYKDGIKEYVAEGIVISPVLNNFELMRA